MLKSLKRKYEDASSLNKNIKRRKNFDIGLNESINKSLIRVRNDNNYSAIPIKKRKLTNESILLIMFKINKDDKKTESNEDNDDSDDDSDDDNDDSDEDSDEDNEDSDEDSDEKSDDEETTDTEDTDNEDKGNKNNKNNNKNSVNNRNNKFGKKKNDIPIIIPLVSFLGNNPSPKTTTQTVPKPLPKEELKCNNPLCNHKTIEEDPAPINMPKKDKIKNIDCLIELGKLYHCKKNKEYNGINLRILNNLVPPLTELKNMIGMKTVKESMVNQILFFLQGFNKKNKCGSCIDCTYNLPCAINQDDMLHTVITGPPGVGKTVLGKILAKVYKEMGVLSKGDFTLVSRSDLVGKYLGHTAAKTQAKIDQCLGGVMFIDEAYSLGHKEGRDSFSKECLDTLNQNLTEKRDLLVIIAGYHDALEESFFNMNEGLRRRFTFRYDIEKYTPSELRDIFLLKVKNDDWKVECYLENDNSKSKESNNLDKPIENDKVNIKKQDDRQKLLKFFEENHEKFINYGGDVETLLLNCKIVHCKRVLFEDPFKRRILTVSDIEEGFKGFIKNRKYKDDPYKDFPKHLYI